MKNPPEIIIEALEAFAPHFRRRRTWEKAKTLVVGSVLMNGRRLVTTALGTMGLQENRSYNQYHHVLSRGQLVTASNGRNATENGVKRFFRGGSTARMWD